MGWSKDEPFYRRLVSFLEDELLRLWLAATDRQAVTNASNAIDRQLRIDPYSQSRAVEEDLYELVIEPLRVLYSVSEPDCLVTVYGVALA